MTLVEVVGGLGLLATLLVAVLLAKGRYTRQAAIAERRLRAVAAADELLAAWHQNAAPLPREGEGLVSGDSDLSWRTRTIVNPDINDLNAEVVRLEILENRTSSAANPVLASVEFVVERRAENVATPKIDTAHPNTQGRRRASPK
jgi:hypothetical protein